MRRWVVLVYRACTALSNLTLGMMSLCTLDMCALSVGRVA